MKGLFRSFPINYRLGLRIIKTGIAVTFCMTAFHLLHMNQPFIAVVATVISMGKSIDLSIQSGKDKMIGVIIGTAVGTAFAALTPGNAGLGGIGMILSLYLCQLFHLESAEILSSISFAAVMFGAAPIAPWEYALSCMGAALLGICIAVIVNLIVMPPNHAMEIKQSYAALQKNIAAEIHNASERKMVHSKLIGQEIQNLSQAIQLYISEAKILRWNDDEVFRISSSIKTFQLILDELKAVEIMELTKEETPNAEILTVYRYHMRRMHELFQSVRNSNNI